MFSNLLRKTFKIFTMKPLHKAQGVPKYVDTGTAICINYTTFKGEAQIVCDSVNMLIYMAMQL